MIDKKTYIWLIGLCFMLISCGDKKKETINNTSVVVEKNRPMKFDSDDAFLEYIQKTHFNYMWEGAEPNSGLARERIHVDGNYPLNDQNIVTTGGSGFGITGLIVAMERGFISREEGTERLLRIVDFLEKADRFHGVWPHWLDGTTGKVKPFGTKDNGGDLVESAFLMQGLLCVRQYFLNGNDTEKEIATRIDVLWKEMDWTWYLNGKNVLYWHWSPEYNWEMNLPIRGYDECLITYILAASSPTHTIPAEVYHEGWARNGEIKSDAYAYGLPLILKHNGAEAYGGPLFLVALFLYWAKPQRIDR